MNGRNFAYDVKSPVWPERPYVRTFYFMRLLLKNRNISGKLEPGHNVPADHAFVMHRFNTAKCHLIRFHNHSLLLYRHSKLTFFTFMQICQMQVKSNL